MNFKTDIIFSIIQKSWGFISQSIPISQQAIFFTCERNSGNMRFSMT